MVCICVTSLSVIQHKRKVKVPNNNKLDRCKVNWISLLINRIIFTMYTAEKVWKVLLIRALVITLSSCTNSSVDTTVSITCLVFTLYFSITNYENFMKFCKKTSWCSSWFSFVCRSEIVNLVWDVQNSYRKC